MYWLRFFCCGEKTQEKKVLSIVPVEEKTREKKQSVRADQYDGELLGGRPNGHGKMMYGNGDYYIGEWVLGVKEGRGLQIYQETGIKYEGQFQNGLPHGTGKLTTPNNSIYNGEFKRGLKHEKGVFQDSMFNKKFQQIYEYGQLKERIEINNSKGVEEDYATFDKQRFDSQEMEKFKKSNPQIRKLNVDKLLEIYGLIKVFNFEKKHPKDWNTRDLMKFLQKINLGKYKQVFYDNKVRGKDLLILSPSELKKDLAMKVGDRKKLSNYIYYLSRVFDDSKSMMKVRQQKEDKRARIPSLSSKKRMSRNTKRHFLNDSIEEQNKESSSERSSNISNSHFEETFPKKKEYNNYTNHNSQFNSAQDCLSLRLQQTQRETEKKAASERSSNSKESVNQQNSNQSKKEDEVLAVEKSSQKKSSTQSSWSSNIEEPELKRRRTSSGAVQQTQIQKILEFIKSNAGLDLIKEKDLQLLEQIGEGGYGKVYKAKYIGSLIAVKDYMRAGKKGNCEDFMKEVEVVSGLKHPNIVLSMGMCITASRYRLITEFMENGSLFDQLHRKKKHFLEEERLEILDDIVKGMVYLHNMKKILHRDLKSSNVLIAENGKVKLCDFGLSAYRSSRRKQKNRVGTYPWMAPEVIRQEGMDFPADVYSFGIIIWELLAEKIPYEGLSQQQIIGTVGQDQSFGLQIPVADPFLINIMNKCLDRVPSKRPTFLQIQEELNIKMEDKNNQN